MHYENIYCTGMEATILVFMDMAKLSNLRVCSKSKCTREIPLDDTNKTCAKCQEADRLSKARKRKWEEEANHVGPTPPTGEPLDESEVGEKQTVTSIKFHGTYTVPVDPMMCEKDHVQSTALEVWRTTGYHFQSVKTWT
ncbi:hypothetical protein EDD15DRAFT_2202791 [Pisolithus albus]|nr:hypothetical protein EDD15DRAFT_2202791 [Pisolithus albus]